MQQQGLLEEASAIRDTECSKGAILIDLLSSSIINNEKWWSECGKVKLKVMSIIFEVRKLHKSVTRRKRNIEEVAQGTDSQRIQQSQRIWKEELQSG